MKFILTALIILFSLSAYTQTQPKVDTANYVLIGKMPDFKLLFMAITQPDDVTANQKKSVAEWINKGLQVLNAPKVDSTKTLPNKTKPK